MLEKRVRINMPGKAAVEATEDQPAQEAAHEHHGKTGKVTGLRQDEGGDFVIVTGDQGWYEKFPVSGVELLDGEQAAVASDHPEAEGDTQF